AGKSGCYVESFTKARKTRASKKCLEYDSDAIIVGHWHYQSLNHKKSCLGVVELIMMHEKTNLGPEVDKNLFYPMIVFARHCALLLSDPKLGSFAICNGVRQNALVEIFQILTMVCETHKLALAQTWVPCKHRKVLADGGGSVKKSCKSFDGSCMGQVCM
ncbi:hypothetical protein IFM89_027334, partial [Coptis chinensis]